MGKERVVALPADDGRGVRFEMVLCLEESNRAVAAWRAWFQLALDVFSADLGETVVAAAPFSDDLVDHGPPYGNPGDPWATVTIRRAPDQRRANIKAFSQENWQRFLDQLATRPGEAVLNLRTLNEVGGLTGGRPSMSARSHLWSTDGADWLQLTTSIPLRWLADRRFHRQVVDAWRDLADRCTPMFGEIGRGSGHGTELESHLPDVRGLTRDHIPYSETVLRGYGWVTVCSETIGERLGGLEALSASGAFQEVYRLANGGYWLQATIHYDLYNMVHAERVFRVVAPCLLSGMPSPSGPFDEPARLVLADAREYHRD
jgi:hypothetical protein